MCGEFMLAVYRAILRRVGMLLVLESGRLSWDVMADVFNFWGGNNTRPYSVALYGFSIIPFKAGTDLRIRG